MRVLRGNDIIVNWVIHQDIGGLITDVDFSKTNLSVFILNSYGKQEAEFKVAGNVISVHIGGEIQRLGNIGLDAYWQDKTSLTWSRAKKNNIVELVDNPENVNLTNITPDIDIITISASSDSFFGGTYVANFNNYYTKNEIDRKVITSYNELNDKPLIYDELTGIYKAIAEIQWSGGVSYGNFIAGKDGAMIDSAGNGEFESLIVRNVLLLNGIDISTLFGTGSLDKELVKILSLFAFDEERHGVYLKSIPDKEGVDRPVGFYSNSFLSALGFAPSGGGGGEGGGGLDENLLWEILGDGVNPNKQIALSHLSNVTAAINSHINNADVHITQEDRININAILSMFELDDNGDIKTKDYIDNGIVKHRGFYSNSFVSTLGLSPGISGGGGGGGMDENLLWSILGDGDNPNKQINISHLTVALNNYATTIYVTDAISGVNSNIDKVKSDVAALAQRVTTHINDVNVHITETERKAIALFSSMFELDVDNNIKTKSYDNNGVSTPRGFYSESFISTLGLSQGSGGSGGGGIDENQLWNILGNNGTEQISYTHLSNAITNALTGYATESWVSSNYASKTELSTVKTNLETLTNTVSSLSNELHDFLDGTDTDTIINRWKELETFLNGFIETQTLSELLSYKVDKTTKIEAGIGLSGGGDLNNNITLNLASDVITPGTYFKTTFDTHGRAINGENPTTLLGFGITDGVNNVVSNGTGNAVTSASINNHILTLTKGATFLEKAVFDDLFEKVNVGTAESPTYVIKAKYGLCTDHFLSALGIAPDLGGGNQSVYTIYLGDVAYTSSDGVINLPAYPSGGGGGISSWEDIIDKPTWIGSIKPTYNYSEVGAAAASHVHNYASTVKLGTVSYDIISNVISLPTYPTSLPASDVYAWAKASSKPTYTKSEIGLGNVDNTSDSSKNVLSATRLTTARTLWGQSFNGTSNISGSIVGCTALNGGGSALTLGNVGNSSYINVVEDIRQPSDNWKITVAGAASFNSLTVSNTISGTITSATKLQTARSIWGQSFNGTGNVSGAMTGVSTISASGRITTSADIYASSWIRTGGNTGWYNETYGGGIYMIDTNYVQVSHGKKFHVGNTTSDAINIAGGFHSTRHTVYSGTWQNVLNPENALLWSNQRSMNTSNVHNIIGWSDIHNGQGYITRYSIASIRNGGWGSMVFSVGTSDNGTSGRQLVLNGNGNAEWAGDFVATGAVTALSSASDIRLKQDLTEYSALPLINNLRSVAYKWNEVAKAKSDIFNNDEWQFGLIAQELQAMFPLFVKDVFGDYLTIDYERLIPVCWRGIQELSEISNKHESRLDKLERENRELKKEVKQLKEKSYGKD